MLAVRRRSAPAKWTSSTLPTTPSPYFAARPVRLVRPLSSQHSVKSSRDVAVLGGGVTGLACAYYILRAWPHANITLYEAHHRLGGWLQSTRVPVRDGSVLFEAGPRSLRPQSNGVLTASLMQELDLAKHAIFTQLTSPAARNRYVYFPDHLVRMPHPSFGLADNLWNLWSEPVFQSAIWSGMKEMWTHGRDPTVQDESIGDFFSRRFSKTMVDRIVSAIIHGIYAGDVWQLSAKSLFPGPWRDEGLHGSVFYGMLKARAEGIELTKREVDFLQSMKDFRWDPLMKATLKDTSVFTFKDGIKMLSDGLHSKLFESGRVEFKTGTPVKTIAQVDGNTGIQLTVAGEDEPRMYSHVISALSPWHLNELTSGTATIPEIPSVTVMTVNLYYRTPGLHEPGFGYLIPMATPFEQNPERALGVVFDTAYAPAPSDVDPSNWHLSADQLKEAQARGRLINVNDFAWYNMPAKPNIQDEVPARGTKVTVMLGGHWWNGWPSFPDEKEGLSLARSLLERHLGIKEEPEAWQVNLEKNCIPQYTVGHEQRLKQAHNNIWREYKGRLRVAGNWISGVGVNDCLRSAYEVAKNLSRDGTGLEHVGEAPTVRLKPIRPNAKSGEDD